MILRASERRAINWEGRGASEKKSASEYRRCERSGNASSLSVIPTNRAGFRDDFAALGSPSRGGGGEDRGKEKPREREREKEELYRFIQSIRFFSHFVRQTKRKRANGKISPPPPPPVDSADHSGRAIRVTTFVSIFKNDCAEERATQEEGRKTPCERKEEIKKSGRAGREGTQSGKEEGAKRVAGRGE